MSKEFKVLLTGFLMLVFIWTTHYLSAYIYPENIYVSDFTLYFYPIVITIIFSLISFSVRKKEIAIGIIIGGVIYILGLWLNIWWDFSEMPCGTKYFFDLFTKCQ